MIIAKLRVLVWDEWNGEHIKKHKVTIKEVEEAYQSKIVETSSYLGRTVILGKTKKGRLLTIVVSSQKQQHPYVVSARDMSKKERRIYYESQKKSKKTS